MRKLLLLTDVDGVTTIVHPLINEMLTMYMPEFFEWPLVQKGAGTGGMGSKIDAASARLSDQDQRVARA
jgi:glutamate 5-kinase